MSAIAADRPATYLCRFAAALIALAAIVGIAIQAQVRLAISGSLPETIWILARYFTVLTNVLVAVVFGLITFGVRVSPRLVGGTVLAILLVGAVYEILLAGLLELSGGSAIANILLHRITPIAAPLFWLAFTPKGTLRWIDPLLWALYPVVYLVYALIRGYIEGLYAYPFIDVAANGPFQVAVSVTIIAAAFLACGTLVVWLDRRLARR